MLAVKQNDLVRRETEGNGQPADKLFTIKGIEKLKCPAGKREVRYRDPQTRGLFVSVTANGFKSFVYRRKVGGMTRQKLIGNLPETKIEQARTIAATLNAVTGRGENPFDEAQAIKQELTFKNLFEAYLTRHALKSRKTGEIMRKDFDRWLGHLGNRKSSNITRSDADKLHGKLAQERGEYSANRAIQLARAVYNKARSLKLYIGDNPFSGITLFTEKPRERFLSSKEAGKILKALQTLPADPYGDLRDFILLAMFTGARKTNILSMRWRDVDLQTARWVIPDTKNGTSQTVPLGGTELAILKRREEAAGKEDLYVFPGDGKKGHLIDLKRSWTTFREKIVGIPDITIHDLRRSLASTMAGANVNVALIRSALHHKDLKTTMNVYARTGKQAELDAKQLAHNIWLDAAGMLPKKNNVRVLPKTRTKRRQQKANLRRV